VKLLNPAKKKPKNKLGKVRIEGSKVMARSVNQVILMGNLTRDPELRQTPSGQSVVSFSLALNRAYKDQSGDWQEATDFIDVVAWGPLAERVSQYLSKGRRALVQGRMQSRSWEQDGQKRSKVEVLANDVTFLDGRSDSESGTDSGAPSASSSPSSSPASGSSKKKDTVIEDIGDEPINLDDIPF
jgi:single-strand DNA-binding protein